MSFKPSTACNLAVLICLIKEIMTKILRYGLDLKNSCQEKLNFEISKYIIFAIFSNTESFSFFLLYTNFSGILNYIFALYYTLNYVDIHEYASYTFIIFIDVLKSLIVWIMNEMYVCSRWYPMKYSIFINVVM